MGRGLSPLQVQLLNLSQKLGRRGMTFQQAMFGTPETTGFWSMSVSRALRRLVARGLMTKVELGIYRLTDKGAALTDRK